MATTSLDHELASRRGPGRPRHEPATFAGDLLFGLTQLTHAASGITFPSSRYRADPVAFSREILGEVPWSKQVEILEAIRDHARVAVRSGHKIGKLLHDDTPIPTPAGWKRHGDLRVGDQLFADTGAVCRVVAVHPWKDRPLYRVTFEDGTHVDADEHHEWIVHTRESRKRGKPPVKLETRELRDAITVPNGSHPDGSPRRVANYTIDLPGPLETPDATLPLDPYLLGVWLGDGSTHEPSVTTPDEAIEAAFHAAGFTTKRYADKGRAWTFAAGTTQAGSPFRAALVAAGVLHDKHVPDAYLWSSAAQRLALLQGLMDTDGTISARGVIEFNNTNERLSRAVLQLARSLGIKARIHERRATLNGRDCGPVWDVSWAAPVPVFRLARQLARIRSAWAHKANAHKRLAVVAVEPLPECVDAQCISVDSPSRLYLCGESMVPTHNSRLAATAALWWYASHDAARCVMTSTTARQVDEILWREVRMLRAKAGACVDCRREAEADPTTRLVRPCPHSSLLDGDLGEAARTGLRSLDFREVVGFTARQAEAVAGISGAHILYIVDEASGVPDVIFEAIEGNRAGSAKLLLLGNPTRNEGEFFAAFNAKARFYKTFTVASTDTPNVQLGRVVVPGLATREWCDEKADEWGIKSPLYTVRVKGEHAEHEQGRIFSLHDIAQAEQRWSETPAEGRLYIGLDPAGEKGSGDDTVFCIRRGLRALELRVRQGLDAEGHLAQLLLVLHDHALTRETPVVVVDYEGSVGADVYGSLRRYVDRHPGRFELVRVRASDKSLRQPEIYDRMRDALAASLLAWFDQGGAIPEDAKLEKELHAMEWIIGANGRQKVTPKTELRKKLGRSPDRFDALALSVWEPLALREQQATPAVDSQPVRDYYYQQDRGALDPYVGASAWERR